MVRYRFVVRAHPGARRALSTGRDHGDRPVTTLPSPDQTTSRARGGGASVRAPDRVRTDRTIDGDAVAGAPETPEPRPPRWRPIRRYEATGRRFLPGLWFPVAVFVVWRLAHLGVVAAVGGDLVGSATAYDGARYLDILHDGYAGWRRTMPNTAFFPLLSWLGRPVAAVTGSDAWTVHLLVTATGLGTFASIWGVAREWKDEVVARRSVVLLALFPSSLFLWAFYTEGLFIALGAGAVWADRRGRHGWAALALGALAATRSVGILVPAVLVLLRLVRGRRVDRWVLGYSAAGAAGLGAVLWNMRSWTGDPFMWTKVQDDWGRSVAPPWASVLQGYRNLWPDEDTIMVPALIARNWDLWCVAIVLVGLVYAAASRRDRWPAETWLLGGVLAAVPLCSSALASFNRFTLATWVLFPVYASMWGRFPRWLKWVTGPAVVVALSVTTVLMIERFTAEPFPRFVG